MIAWISLICLPAATKHLMFLLMIVAYMLHYILFLYTSASGFMRSKNHMYSYKGSVIIIDLHWWLIKWSQQNLCLIFSGVCWSTALLQLYTTHFYFS
jgi:hypothetical protein